MIAGLNTKLCGQKQGSFTYFRRRFAIPGIASVTRWNVRSKLVARLDEALRRALEADREERDNKERDFCSQIVRPHRFNHQDIEVRGHS